jgi:hypothetical protein
MDEIDNFAHVLASCGMGICHDNLDFDICKEAPLILPLSLKPNTLYSQDHDDMLGNDYALQSYSLNIMCGHLGTGTHNTIIKKNVKI